MNRRSGEAQTTGSKRDVELTLNLINPGELTTLSIAGEPFDGRRTTLVRIIDDLRLRVAASEEGGDLKPVLEDAERALEILDRRRARKAF